MAFSRLALLFVVALALAACAGNQNKRERRGHKVDPAASVTTQGPTNAAQGETAPANPGGTTAGGIATEGEDSGFETATEPTAIIAAYLTAHRDAPTSADVLADAITVFAVVRDESGKPLPKPLTLDLAVATFDDKSEVVGTVDADPQHAYHAVFKVPKGQLAALSIGKDKIKGRIKLGSPAFAATTIETDVVLWLANVVLTVEREDFGVLRLPPVGEPAVVVKAHVAVSGYEQPAQNAYLKGLGELAVSGGTCPALSETVPKDLTTDCDLEIAIDDVMTFDRVLTLTYYNGVREDFTSVILRGESALTLASATPYGKLAAHAGRLVASTADVDGAHVAIWNEVPKRSGVPPDVILGTAWESPPVATAANIGAVFGIAFAGERLVVLDGNVRGQIRAGRLLIWNDIPKDNGANADYVLSGLYNPRAGLGYDGQRLFVGEWRAGFEGPGDYSRFLVFDHVAFGEPQLAATFPAPDTPTTEFVGRLAYAGGRYFEMNTQRLRVWSKAWPFAYFTADQAIGGPYFPLLPGNAPPPAAPAEVRGARAVASDGATLAIADGARILVWDPWPLTDAAPADFALGQRDLVSNVPNAFGDSLQSIGNAEDVLIVGDKLVVVDSGRIVIRSLPRKRPKLEMPPRPSVYLDGESAPGLLSFSSSYFELGIVDRDHASEHWLAVEYSGSTAVEIKGAGFDDPSFLFAGGSYPGTGGTCGTTIQESCLLRVAFSDRTQGRRQAKLDLEFENGVERRTTAITLQASVRPVASESFEDQRSLSTDGGNLLLAWDHCLYLYRSDGLAAPLGGVPIHLGARNEYDCVDPELTSVGGIIDFYDPNFAAASAGRLFVGAAGDVAVYGSAPTVSGAPPDFTLPVAEREPVPFQNFDVVVTYAATALAAGGRLYVSLCGTSHRILVWSAVPTAAVAPDATIAFPAPYEGACVTDLFAIDGKLIGGFEDGGYPEAQGIFIWDALPNASTPPSRIVTGLSRATYGGRGMGRFAWDGTRFYSLDRANHAVRVWFDLPDPLRAPDVVLGQLEKNGEAPDDGGAGAWSFSYPSAVMAEPNRVYVKDARGYKVFKPPMP